MPEASARWPIVLSVGARTGRVGLLATDQTYEVRLRAEAYPRLNPEADGSTRCVLAFGMSAGSFLHDMAIPAAPDPNPPEIGSGPPHALLVRPELRLEGFV